MTHKIVYLLVSLFLVQMLFADNFANKDLGAIWFIGDSITQGNADEDPEGSPRKALYDLLKANGYEFSFTGHHRVNVDGLPETGQQPETNLFQYHSGVSGYLIGEPGVRMPGIGSFLESFWSSGRLATVKPKVVCIMIGTNDIGRHYQLAEAPVRLKQLIEALYALPGIGEPTVFVSSVPPIRGGTTMITHVAGYNQAIPKIVEEFKTQGRQIHYVDSFTPLVRRFEETMCSDGLHPNATGNAIIAKQWFRALESKLNLKQPVKLQTVYEPDEKHVYKETGDTRLHLHRFEPDSLKSTDRRPAVVFFFGGGWVSGTPKHFYEQADVFRKRGIVAFVAEYRVRKRNQTTPFDAVEDAKSAIRWVRDHASELGVDPERIIAAGGSAGGHLAASTGVIDGFEAVDEDLDISSVPNAMILFNPVLDTTEKGYGMSLVGEARKTDVSITHHVKPGVVPTLLMHGTSDKVVPYENAERFAALMNVAGNRCDLITYEGFGHGFFNGRFFRPKKKDTTNFDRSIENCFSFLHSLGYVDTSGKVGEL